MCNWNVFVCLAKTVMNFHGEKVTFYKYFHLTLHFSKHFSAGFILGFGAEASIKILSVYSSALWKFFR